MPLTAGSASIADKPTDNGNSTEEPLNVRNCSRIGLRANPPRRRIFDVLLRAWRD